MPKFTKQHYEMIADVLHESFAYQLRGTTIVYDNGLIVDRFIYLFKKDNPAFKPEKFRDRVNGL